MKNNIIRPLYILIGLLFVALFVQGYFIYDLKKNNIEQNREVSLVQIPTHKVKVQTNNYTDPFIEMQKLQEQMMKEFENFNSTFANDPYFKNAFSNTRLSAVSDIIEKDKEYIIEVKIPGVDGQKIEVTSKENRVHIYAKSQKTNEQNNTNYIHKESYSNYFQRDFLMPEDADLETMKSDYKNGVLRITVQKKNQ